MGGEDSKETVRIITLIGLMGVSHCSEKIQHTNTQRAESLEDNKCEQINKLLNIFLKKSSCKLCWRMTDCSRKVHRRQGVDAEVQQQ